MHALFRIQRDTYVDNLARQSVCSLTYIGVGSTTASPEPPTSTLNLQPILIPAVAATAVILVLCACSITTVLIVLLKRRKRRLELVREEAFTDSMFQMGPKALPLHATNLLSIDEWEIPASQVRPTKGSTSRLAVAMCR